MTFVVAGSDRMDAPDLRKTIAESVDVINRSTLAEDVIRVEAEGTLFMQFTALDLLSHNG